MENYRSTFPLDEKALARRALGQILGDPVTWVPLLPGVAAYTLFDVPLLLALALEAVVLVGLAFYWRGRWSGMMDTLRRNHIREHNRLQDAMLAASVNSIRAAGAVDYANRLAQFLQIKREVEQRLHEEGTTINAQKIQLERLVDSLCFGVRDELLAQVEKKKDQHENPADRHATMARVDAALATLQSTVAELDTILEPMGLAGNGDPGESIEQLTQRLREETEIARRVQARLRADENTPDAVEPPRIESQ
jgi:hypothetical protein